MAGDGTNPMRLVNFVSEEKLVEAKRTRGERVDDGTAQRDRPLYEILKENKDRRDAEFNERFKHRPPKALDEDETEFLDKLETSQKEYERKVADDEAQQLYKFQAAVATHSMIVHELKEEPASHSNFQEPKVVGKKTWNPLSSMVIKVKPQVKKAKLDLSCSESHNGCEEKLEAGAKTLLERNTEAENKVDTPFHDTGLVPYSDESDKD